MRCSAIACSLLDSLSRSASRSLKDAADLYLGEEGGGGQRPCTWVRGGGRRCSALACSLYPGLTDNVHRIWVSDLDSPLLLHRLLHLGAPPLAPPSPLLLHRPLHLGAQPQPLARKVGDAQG